MGEGAGRVVQYDNEISFMHRVCPIGFFVYCCIRWLVIAMMIFFLF